MNSQSMLQMQQARAQGQPAALQSQPAASQSQPAAAQGQSVSAPSQAAALQSQPAASQSQPAAEPDRPTTIPQRVGLGYDVHAFAAVEDNRKLILGGVHIPYERGLLAHSDADVLVHAIMDALLGAAREGDIGAHFPDSDPAYKDADSLMLLENVRRLLHEKGWQILDIDSVIIAQAPRLSPYRDLMRAHIAETLGIDTSQVGVKATTTEYLGFEGRGEGIAAQAVVMLGRR